MAAKYWIKLYIEVLHDAKVATLPDYLWRRYFECCLMAGELDKEGMLPDLETMSWVLRMPENTLDSQLYSLVNSGLLEYWEEKGKGKWKVKGYKRRQAPVSVSERVARFRDQGKKDSYYGDLDIENGNENVTKRYKDVTDHGNKSLQTRYTDIESDIELDIEESIEEEIDHPKAIAYRNLLNAFINESQIPLYTVNRRDNEALVRMVEAGCIAEDVKEAVKYATENGLTIVSVASIEKGSIISRSKRVRGEWKPGGLIDYLEEETNGE